MKIFLNYHDRMEAELEKNYNERQHISESDMEQEQKLLEGLEEARIKDEEKYRYIYSKERDETFQEMIRKAIGIGQYFDFNVEITYLDEEAEEDFIVLSGWIMHFSKENQSYLDDLCWLFKTATKSVVEGMAEKMICLFWYRVNERVPVTEEPPEA